MNYKKTIALMMISTTMLGTVGGIDAFATEKQQDLTGIQTSSLKEATRNVNALFKDEKHKEIANTSCAFQKQIEDVIEQVKRLPNSQEKLDLSNLVYLANNLYYEARGALSLRQRADRINQQLNQYFTDSSYKCLTSDFGDLYDYNDGNYGGLYDVVLRYQKLGLPENTPSLKKDFGMINYAYKLYTEGKIAENIPDKNLRKAINTQLKLPENNEIIEKEQLLTIKTLDLTNYQINDLTGINSMKNLETLKLVDNASLNFKILNYSKDTALNSLKTLFVKNMQNDHTSYVRGLARLQTFEADGGNVYDASDIVDYINNVKILNQKIVAPKERKSSLGLTVPLYNLKITNYGAGDRLVSQLKSFKVSNNGTVSGAIVNWKLSDLENVKQVSCTWNSEKFSGKYIIPVQ